MEETDALITRFVIRKNLAFTAVEAPEFEEIVMKGRPSYKVRSFFVKFVMNLFYVMILR